MKSTPIQKIRTLQGVSEYRLANGLRVLFRHETASPVVAICVTFHVGSRNEAPGHTGATHILEHLLFKDSLNFNRANGKSITDYLEWFGALLNATTSNDRTNYFELLPRERLPEALQLEADRMRGSLFSDADLATEMTVVRNEYERSRNNPFELLEEAVTAKAFTVHPYRIPTIGTKQDIERSTAKKLREFYDAFYWPNNATLTVIGDVSWGVVQKFVLAYFGPIPMSSRPIPRMRTKEPLQTTPRSCSLKKPLGISLVSLMYKIPEATHADYPALLLLAMVLGGGFSSRLQQALVDTGLAVGISVNAYALHDPGVLSFMIHVADGVDPKKVLAATREELARFTSEGCIPKELAYAKERALSSIAAGRDGVLNEARTLSEAIAVGDWTMEYRLEKILRAVGVADISRVAKKYLKSGGETSGILHNSA